MFCWSLGVFLCSSKTEGYKQSQLNYRKFLSSSLEKNIKKIQTDYALDVCLKTTVCLETQINIARTKMRLEFKLWGLLLESEYHLQNFFTCPTLQTMFHARNRPNIFQNVSSEVSFVLYEYLTDAETRKA